MTTTVQTTDWGPLSEPIHTDVADTSRPWRDNAFICFWDPARDVVGTLHTSTSPNAEGRRARFSLQSGGTVIELVESLDPGTFSSESITFDAGASFSVNSDRVSAEITTAPLQTLADYTGDRSPMAFSLDKEKPLMHYQRGATVSGQITLDGRTIEIEGTGFRDRTWGYRDESASVNEYFGCMWVFPEFVITSMRLLGEDGKSQMLGFVLSDDARPVRSHSMTRDASGLFAASKIELEDGTVLDIRATDRRAGFWCPMGWEHTGPAMSAYDEFCAVRTADGQEGFGLIEQGILKRLY